MSTQRPGANKAKQGSISMCTYNQYTIVSSVDLCETNILNIISQQKTHKSFHLRMSIIDAKISIAFPDSSL